MLEIDCLYPWVQHDVQIFSGESILACTFNYTLTNVLSNVRAVGEPLFFLFRLPPHQYSSFPPFRDTDIKIPTLPHHTNRATQTPLHLKLRPHFLSLDDLLPFQQPLLETGYPLPHP